MFNIISFEELDSTNNYAKNNIAILNDGDVIFAKKQTNGRGRMNRAWSSASGNLTFTIVIKDKFLLSKFDSLSLLSSSAIFNVLSKYTSFVSIKWPNDVYIKDKKISGILLEGASTEEGLSYLLIGIGININISSFPLELQNKATSLFLETNVRYDVTEILRLFLKEFENLVSDLRNNKNTYLDIIRSHNYLLHKTAYAHFSSIEGEVKIIDIMDNNKLKVLYNDEIYELESGEITFHK